MGGIETETVNLGQNIPNNTQNCRQKKKHKRKVKLNEMKGSESLQITQRVRMRKQRIKCILNVNNISENYQSYSKIRKDKQNFNKSPGLKKKHQTNSYDKNRSPEKHRTNNLRFFDGCKTDSNKSKRSVKCETGISSFGKSHEKYKTDSSSFDKTKSTDNQHNKSLHSSGTMHDSLSSKNRIVPMCLRDACRPSVSVKTCNCQLKRQKRKLKKIRKREAKLNNRDISLSPISSPSIGQCDISYENISSDDGVTSYDGYNAGNKIDRLIKRTKDRDKRKNIYRNKDLRPISTSTPKCATGLAKEGISDSEPSLEMKENDVVTICIGDSDEEVCHSNSAHSFHSQSTLILESIPSSAEHADKENFDRNNLYYPSEPVANHTYSPTNHTYSPTVSPENNHGHFYNAISFTPRLDTGTTSYSTSGPEKHVFQRIDKPIGDLNYSAPQPFNQFETFSNSANDPKVASIHSKSNEASMMSSFDEKQVYSDSLHFQNAVNVVNNDINQYYNCNTSMIGQFFPAVNSQNVFVPNTNQGISEIRSSSSTLPAQSYTDIQSSSTMPAQRYTDIQSYQYYYYPGMYVQSQLPQTQPEIFSIKSVENGLPTITE